MVNKRIIFGIQVKQEKKEKYFSIITHSESKGREELHCDIPEVIRKVVQKWLKNKIKENRKELDLIERMERGEFENAEEKLLFETQGERNKEFALELLQHYDELWKELEKERLREKIRQLN